MNYTFRAPPPARVPAPVHPLPYARALGAAFDGATTWLTRGGDLTGNADGKRGIVSVWARFLTDTGNSQIIVDAQSNYFNVLRLPSGTIRIYGYTGTADALNLESVSTYAIGPIWHHILAAWDVAIARAQMWIDGVDVANVVTLVDAAIDYTRTNWRVGAEAASGGAVLAGEIADLYLNLRDSLDLSLAAVRERFRTAAGGPADLGPIGEYPTGSSPIVFLPRDHVAHGINLGTGGDFSGSGTLAAPVLSAGIRSRAATRGYLDAATLTAGATLASSAVLQLSDAASLAAALALASSGGLQVDAASTLASALGVSAAAVLDAAGNAALSATVTAATAAIADFGGATALALVHQVATASVLAAQADAPLTAALTVSAAGGLLVAGSAALTAAITLGTDGTVGVSVTNTPARRTLTAELSARTAALGVSPRTVIVEAPKRTEPLQ